MHTVGQLSATPIANNSQQQRRQIKEATEAVETRQLLQAIESAYLRGGSHDLHFSLQSQLQELERDKYAAVIERLNRGLPVCPVAFEG